ncbi:hypothetical protein NE624_19120, partial [Alistipes onderdonkii]|nr:hypothetical protein [Alistipes onderdonkii]
RRGSFGSAGSERAEHRGKGAGGDCKRERRVKAEPRLRRAETGRDDGFGGHGSLLSHRLMRRAYHLACLRSF